MSTTPFQGNPTFDQRLAEESLVFKALARYIAYDLRVAMPGIIVSFDATTQTAVVQIATRDRIKINNVFQHITIDKIPDVPIVMPRAGGFSVTMPVTAGDECLLIIADRCINAWWANGGVQNQEVDRAHDYSDCFAILGPWSQQRLIPTYSTDSMQIGTDDGTVGIEITDANVNISATNITLSASTELTLDGSAGLAISGMPTSTAPAYPTFSLPIKISGVTYYLQLKTTP